VGNFFGLSLEVMEVLSFEDQEVFIIIRSEMEAR
jgi:hypothetical protein